MTTLALLICAYYVLNPDTLARHKELAGGIWNKVRRQVAIWETRKSIQSLPEV